MPILVHLADARDANSIRRNGLKPGKNRGGIFCMPVLPDYYVSHQWLRELKHGKATTLVGVYFKVDSAEKVFAGRFNQAHRHLAVGEAISEIQQLADPLGYELIIDRKITAAEISSIRQLPQVTGWRYQPAAKGTRPCGCAYCQRGQPKSAKIKQQYEMPVNPLAYPEILAKLATAVGEDELADLCREINRKPRKSDPAALLFLLDKKSVVIDQELALCLRRFRHPHAKAMLLQLTTRADEATRNYAASSLLELYGQEIARLLAAQADAVLQRAVDEWRAAQNDPAQS